MARREIWIAVVAALITAGATLGGVGLTGCQQTRTDEKALARAQERELRTATRLVQDELLTIEAQLEGFIKGTLPLKEILQKTSEKLLPDTTWVTWKPAIAASEEVPEASWDRLSDFYANVEGVRRILLVHDVRKGDTRKGYPPGFVEGLPFLQQENRLLVNEVLQPLIPN
jgi:hypothetical protein